jgi:predicted ArsR family transcriptional regulator
MSDERYPHHPGAKGRSDTSYIAARLAAPRAKPIRQRTLEDIERAPATAEQVSERIGVHFMICRARCSELRAQGLIEDSGQRGDGALGGKVIVWRATTPAERAAFAAARAAAVRRAAA